MSYILQRIPGQNETVLSILLLNISDNESETVSFCFALIGAHQQECTLHNIALNIIIVTCGSLAL